MNSMSMFTTRGSHSVTPWGRVETSAGAEDVRRTTARWTTDGSRKSERPRRTRRRRDDRRGGRTMDRRTLITTAASRGIFPSAALTSAFVDAAAAAAAAMTVLLTGMTPGATRAARADCEDRRAVSVMRKRFSVWFSLKLFVALAQLLLSPLSPLALTSSRRNPARRISCSPRARYRSPSISRSRNPRSCPSTAPPRSRPNPTRRTRRRASSGRSIRANVGVEFIGVRSGVERRGGRGLKARDPGRRDTTGKVLKKRRSPRRRGRTGTSVQNAPSRAAQSSPAATCSPACRSS